VKQDIDFILGSWESKAGVAQAPDDPGGGRPAGRPAADLTWPVAIEVADVRMGPSRRA